MANSDLHMHYVCTREELAEIVNKQQRFWISGCGCRAGKGKCRRSRTDICLSFQTGVTSGGSGLREASRADVEKLLREAEEKHLVCRPFRDESRQNTVGSCFCCDDCCVYFADPAEKCDKGFFIETTELEKCTHCGACVDVCYFKARRMEGGKLVLDRDNCYGCGLCRDACPERCVVVFPRP
jgi:ferredoxin